MTLDALCSASDVLIYDAFNAAASASASFLFGNTGAAGGVGTAVAAAAAVPVTAMPAGEGEKALQGRRKRRRRARSCKNREDAESQRMTHIAVERNRRRLMNEYLAVLRSLMPESYVHRGDQASIVGGAIDFVKELEQLLQSLEAQKRTLLMQQQHKAKCDAMPMPSTTSTVMTAGVDTTSNCSSDSGAGEAAAAGDPAGTPFAQFFTYPQYVWCHPPRDGGGGVENRAGVADIEVNLVETHASLRVMAPRRPGQLLGMVAGLQALRLTILHLNVTALDSLALYSLSVKVPDSTSSPHILGGRIWSVVFAFVERQIRHRHLTSWVGGSGSSSLPSSSVRFGTVTSLLGWADLFQHLQIKTFVCEEPKGSFFCSRVACFDDIFKPGLRIYLLF